MRNRTSFESYGYIESNAMIGSACSCNCAKGVTIQISKEEGNIISLNKDGALVASLGLQIADNKLSLVNKLTSMVISSVDAPSTECVTDLSYDAINKQLIVCVRHSDGILENKFIDLTDLIVKYTAGDGIDISDENEISVRLSESGSSLIFDAEKCLQVDDDKVASQEEFNKLSEVVTVLSGVVETITESGSVETLIEAIANKADRDELSGLSGSLYTQITKKADASDLELDEIILSKKADQTDLESLSATVETKANEIDLENAISALTESIDLRAYQVDLEAVSGVVSGLSETKADKTALDDKADASALLELSKMIAKKMNIEDAYAELDKKASIYDVQAISGDVSTKAEQDDLNALKKEVSNLELSAVTEDDLDEIRQTIEDNEKVVSGALNDLNSRILDLSGNTIEDINEVKKELSGKADADTTTIMIESLTDIVDGKADKTTVQSVSGNLVNYIDNSVSGKVDYSVYESGQQAQNVKISENANNLGAIVDITKFTDGTYDIDNISISDSKPVDHLSYMFHNMCSSVNNYEFDENNVSGLLTKLYLMLKDIDDSDFDKFVTALKNLIK